jgi:hypothetical protein
MEELFTLKSLLLNGDISGALAVVEELDEMSRDDKNNNIRMIFGSIRLNSV